MRRFVIAAQGAYYLVTGLWPLVSLSTFEAVTGPKTDDWLVHTVGVLAAAIGAALILGARRRTPGRETLVLAASAAVAFGGIDVVYVLDGTISPIYLTDAVVQIAILLALFAARDDGLGGARASTVVASR